MKKERMPRRPTSSIALSFIIAALSAALCGCSSVSQSIEPQPPTAEQKAEQLEPMLAAAGFRMLPADTPQRQQQLSTLVPLDVNYYVGKTGNLHYYMADPDYCKCMYIGTEENYQQYEKIKLNQQFQAKEGEISREDLEAQQMEDMDMQEEMFNPYGLGLVGPMGPAMYW
ncbi:MAG: hypothetical protein WCD12_05365 [Candidatus Binatus sp.]|uniref:hypothetical protein n=1 Tax=Candidatus Binatus sp. TaxID=2811406 RepID=UPI003C73FB1D